MYDLQISRMQDGFYEQGVHWLVEYSPYIEELHIKGSTSDLLSR